MKHKFIPAGLLAIAIAAATPARGQQFSDTVALFRQNDDLKCAGWLASKDVVITAAHCVGRPGHFWISRDQKDYHAYRIRIHPQFTPEILLLRRDETVNPDLALIIILQKDISIEPRDAMFASAVQATMKFFIVRAGEKIEFSISDVDFKKGGFHLSNGGKGLNVCPGDSGSPLYVETEGKISVAGIVVGATPNLDGGADSACSVRLEVVDIDTVLGFYSRPEGQ